MKPFVWAAFVAAFFMISAAAVNGPPSVKGGAPEAKAVCWNQPVWTEVAATLARARAEGGPEVNVVADRAAFMARVNAAPPRSNLPVPDLIAWMAPPDGETVAVFIVLRGCVVFAAPVPAADFRSWIGQASPTRSPPAPHSIQKAAPAPGRDA